MGWWMGEGGRSTEIIQHPILLHSADNQVFCARWQLPSLMGTADGKGGPLELSISLGALRLLRQTPVVKQSMADLQVIRLHG